MNDKINLILSGMERENIEIPIPIRAMLDYFESYASHDELCRGLAKVRRMMLEISLRLQAMRPDLDEIRLDADKHWDEHMLDAFITDARRFLENPLVQAIYTESTDSDQPFNTFHHKVTHLNGVSREMGAFLWMQLSKPK